MPSDPVLEEKLAVISKLMVKMDDSFLQRFRASCVGKHPPSEEDETVLEVVDGELALREIRRDVQ